MPIWLFWFVKMFISFDLRTVLLSFSFFCAQMPRVKQNCFAIVKNCGRKSGISIAQMTSADFMEDKTFISHFCWKSKRKGNVSILRPRINSSNSQKSILYSSKELSMDHEGAVKRLRCNTLSIGCCCHCHFIERKCFLYAYQLNGKESGDWLLNGYATEQHFVRHNVFDLWNDSYMFSDTQRTQLFSKFYTFQRLCILWGRWSRIVVFRFYRNHYMWTLISTRSHF